MSNPYLLPQPWKGWMTGTAPVRNDWIQTNSGQKVFPLDLAPEDISIGDIGHALGNICRFGGHCRHFYSVAQHSVLVSEYLPEGLALAGLLHDAAEAYLGDIMRPLKSRLWALPWGAESYRAVERFESIEKHALQAIFVGLDVGWPNPEEWRDIYHADMVLLATEARDLMSPLHHEWKVCEECGYEVLGREIVPLGPEEARDKFYQKYVELTNE